MSELDKKLFASKHITNQTYWSKDAVQAGSAYFQTNPQKLTRSSFDELVQIVDTPATAINNSSLLDVEKTKEEYSKYLLKDLSNIDDIEEIPEASKEKFIKSFKLIDQESYAQHITEIGDGVVPQYKIDTISEIELTMDYGSDVVVHTGPSDPVILAKDQVLRNFSLTEDVYDCFTVDIGGGRQYYYITGELNADTYPHAVAILQTITVYHSGLSVGLKFNWSGVETCVGEVILQSANGCCTRYIVKPVIETDTVQLRSIYFPYEVSQSHTHTDRSPYSGNRDGDQFIGYRYTTGDTRKMERMVTNIGFVSFISAIPKAFIGLGKVGFILQGIRHAS